MAIREGRWDCPYCGKTLNRGPDKHCSGCGAPRDQDVKFYLPPDAAEVTDAQALAAAKTGPDWHCSYCSGDNPAGAKFCPNCGGGADGSEPKRKVQDIPDQPVIAKPQVSAAPGRGKKILAIAIAAIAAIAAGLYFFVFRTHEEALTVQAHAWERTIEIEKFKTVTEEAWEGSVPADARVQGRHQEVYQTEKIQKGTERVKTGKRDLGNGYFEDVYEDKPVYEERKIYRDKVSYLVDRWRPERSVKAGAQDLNPQWPPIMLAEREREGKREESYRILFTDPAGKGKEWTAKTEAEWRLYQPGAKVKAKVRASGGITEVEKPTVRP